MAKAIKEPHLFSILKIRDCIFPNRIGISPMDLFGATDGKPTDIHFVQYGRYALEGYGFIIFEACAVEPRGRISTSDCGIWDDSVIPLYKKITDFVHSQGTKIGVQLGHAGRKSSSFPPSKVKKSLCCPVNEGGWDVVSPSSVKYTPDWNTTKELTTKELIAYPKIWSDCAVRAVKSGFDFIEIHAAHGYLLHEFISPLTNKRTDIFGGSLDNRLKLLRDVIIEIRKVIPKGMPIFVRLSCEDLSSGGITMKDSIDIAKELKKLGVDLIDCSSAGLVSDQEVPVDPHFQLKYPKQIKTTGILTAAVGNISTSETANKLVTSNEADLVLIGKAALRGAIFPRHAAIDIGAPVPKYFEGISWSTSVPKGFKY